VKTNLEAVQEIVRQIRLRDLGGLLVVDFIDMEEEEHRKELVAALENELKKDRSKNRMLPVSEFGLVEITRKRQRQSLERALTMPCPYCSGSGRIKSVPTVVLEIRREILKKVEAGEAHSVLLRVHPEIYRSLAGEERRLIEELEERIAMPIHVQSDEHLHHERFDIAIEA
jgi:Ribonuclease G/E